MQLASFLPHYQLVCISFDISSFSLISYTLMYPGLGLGVIASTAKLVDQPLLSAAAHALGGIVNASQPGAAVLPPVNKITSFSQHLAEVVAQYAIDHQNTRENITDARAAVERIKWYPSYE